MDFESGIWHDIQSEKVHSIIRKTGKRGSDVYWARVQKGKYIGPGKYLEITYYQRCPRNCCDDLVRELIPAQDVVRLAKDKIKDMAEMIKIAKS